MIHPEKASDKPRKMGCFLSSMIGCGTLVILMIALPISMEMLNRYRFQGCPSRDADVCAALQECKRSSTAPKSAGVACWKAAAAFHRIGTAETMQQALALYQKACTHQIPQACNNMGYLLQTYIRASSSYPFPQTALSSFQQACRLQDPQGCNNLATLHEQHASKEPKRRAEHHTIAEASYQKACTLRNAQACRNLGLFRERWRPRARRLIDQAYQEACRLGDAGGCRNLGFFYEQEKSDPARCKKATPPYQRACKLGDRSLCGYRCVSRKPREQEDEP